ncbi:hypothetical protein AAAQ13_00310 (plasmid) [Lactococcus lactis subsp. lactis]|uniref:hypothetical protein n=1 Tax=Lactococcus lactis TaxID=1358 RepID=UPI00311E9E0C
MRDLAEILEGMEHAEVRRLITEDKIRPDGRKIDEIRPLDAELTLPHVILHMGQVYLLVVKPKLYQH